MRTLASATLALLLGLGSAAHAQQRPANAVGVPTVSLSASSTSVTASDSVIFQVTLSNTSGASLVGWSWIPDAAPNGTDTKACSGTAATCAAEIYGSGKMIYSLTFGGVAYADTVSVSAQAPPAMWGGDDEEPGGDWDPDGENVVASLWVVVVALTVFGVIYGLWRFNRN